MIFCRRFDSDYRRDTLALMVLIVPAQHQFVEHEPVMKRVARGPQTYHRFARFEILLETIQLLLRQDCSPSTQNQKISSVEGFSAWNVVRGLLFEIHTS